MSFRFRLSVILQLLILATLFPTSGRAEDSAVFTGHWEGAIDIPGMNLGIKVDLAHDGASWSGTIDIPMQGAAGLPLTIKHVDGATAGAAATLSLCGARSDLPKWGDRHSGHPNDTAW